MCHNTINNKLTFVFFFKAAIIENLIDKGSFSSSDYL